ncbi:MAG: gfo/Idh/MocA family oxidoreductase, partial [Trueperaceae bacterium]|nr:gfo/Idh/MocA family oxidoreductase [Trueperaceae bacterium]
MASNTIEAGATRRLELVGDRARLLLEDDRLTLTAFDPPLSQHRAHDPDPFGAPALRPHPTERLAATGTHAAVYRDLVAAIRDGRPCRVDGREGRMSLELANAIALSSHRGRPVDLPLDRDAYAAFL